MIHPHCSGQTTPPRTPRLIDHLSPASVARSAGGRCPMAGRVLTVCERVAILAPLGWGRQLPHLTRSVPSLHDHIPDPQAGIWLLVEDACLDSVDIVSPPRPWPVVWESPPPAWRRSACCLPPEDSSGDLVLCAFPWSMALFPALQRKCNRSGHVWRERTARGAGTEFKRGARACSGYAVQDGGAARFHDRHAC